MLSNNEKLIAVIGATGQQGGYAAAVLQNMRGGRTDIVRISEQLTAPPNVEYPQGFSSTLIENARKSRTRR